MRYYTRRQLVEILEVDEGFVLRLEEEDVVECDAPQSVPGEFSERMLERARVANNLVSELDVNLAGAAIIVRMREEMARQRRRIEEFLAGLEE